MWLLYFNHDSNNVCNGQFVFPNQLVFVVCETNVIDGNGMVRICPYSEMIEGISNRSGVTKDLG